MSSRSRGGRNANRGQGQGQGQGQGRGRGRGRGEHNLPFHPRGSTRGRGARGTSQVAVYQPKSPQHLTIDPKVREIEHQIESSLKHTKTTNSDFPQRPGFGTQGREILLWTNYFELIGYGELLLYRYSIDVLPPPGARAPVGKKRRRLVELLLQDHFLSFILDLATDFKSTIISRQELALRDTYEVTYRPDDTNDAGPNPAVYQFKLAQTAVLSTSELRDSVTSTHSGSLFGSKDELIQALNIVLGHYPKASSNVANIAPNKHYNINSQGTFDLGAGVRAIRGVLMSVRAATARVLVNVQVKSAAFYNEGPLEHLMRIFMQENGRSPAKLENFLAKLSIKVTHIIQRDRQGNTKTRIKQISALADRRDGRQLSHPPKIPKHGAGPKEVQFFLANPIGAASPPQRGNEPRAPGQTQGRYITVFEFFRQNHNVTVKDTDLPVVNVGTREFPSYLPAQVCEVRRGQPFAKKLSPMQTANMIKFAVRPPYQNAQYITTSGIETVGLEPRNDTMNQFGLSINPTLQCVPGRILNGPSMRYHGSGIARARFGSWNLAQVKFSTTTDLSYWTYLAISYRESHPRWDTDQNLQAQIKAFKTKLVEVGITATECEVGMHIIVDSATMESTVDKAIHQFMHSTKKKPPRFLLVILPDRDTAIYNRVKYACDIKKGLLNICAVAYKFMKPGNDQYFANMALKVNLKLGGNNHILDGPKLGLISEGKTMLTGIDVTHPSPGSTKSAPSVAGIVASVDRWLGQWPAELRILPPRQETVDGLEAMMTSRLELWWKKNKNTLPENILVYRDGVSEGQYQIILQTELPAIKAAAKKIYPAVDQTKRGLPRVTIVVVGKRHHTRFYPTKTEDADRSSNPPNGTVVDRGVTEARTWDFFLQAHAALQGTARPAHYVVIHDEIFHDGGRRGGAAAAAAAVKRPFANPADVLEDLTHNLCYMFGRATKAVSICPPAYYADLVCERARCYLSGVFDPDDDRASTSTQSTQPAPDASAVVLHPNVRDSMFYL